jgi:hypothetical protein
MWLISFDIIIMNIFHRHMAAVAAVCNSIVTLSSMFITSLLYYPYHHANVSKLKFHHETVFYQKCRSASGIVVTGHGLDGRGDGSSSPGKD